MEGEEGPGVWSFGGPGGVLEEAGSGPVGAGASAGFFIVYLENFQLRWGTGLGILRAPRKICFFCELSGHGP